MDSTRPKPSPQAAQESDPIRRAREDIQCGNFPAAVYFISNVLNPQFAGSKKLHPIQRLRLQLLRADAYSALGSHEKALADARSVAEQHPDCVQARFITGREHLKLFQITESVRAFQEADDMMKEGATQEPMSSRDALAMIGIREEDLSRDSVTGNIMPRKGPIVPSYEWAAEYDVWTRYAAEARCLFQMTKSQVIDISNAPAAIQLLLAKVAASANRAAVITVKNASEHTLQREQEHFAEGEYYDKVTFPTTIHPGQVGVAAVRSSSWRGGSKGCVQYKLVGTALSVVCNFESPLMGTYKSSAIFVGKVVNSKYEHIAKASQKTFKALALVPSQVQSFVVAEVRPQVLRPIELARVLEFLPPYYLKRSTCICRSLRNIVSHFPPTAFFATGNRAFPDYCLLSDFTQNNFTVQDRHEVMWKLVKETSLGQTEISVVDALDHRVFMLSGDFEARTMELEMHYGSKRCLISTLTENWVPLSRSAFVKSAAGRQVGTINMSSAMQLTFFSDLRPNVPLMSVKRVQTDPKSGKETALISLEPSGVQWATATLLPPTSKRSATIAEIALQPGCDAHLSTLLCLYLWARLF